MSSGRKQAPSRSVNGRASTRRGLIILWSLVRAQHGLPSIGDVGTASGVASGNSRSAAQVVPETDDDHQLPERNRPPPLVEERCIELPACLVALQHEPGHPLGRLMRGRRAKVRNRLISDAPAHSTERQLVPRAVAQRFATRTPVLISEPALHPKAQGLGREEEPASGCSRRR
jgi:hypothetical protein